MFTRFKEWLKEMIRQGDMLREEDRRRKAAERQKADEIMAAWNELHKDFVREYTRQRDKEIDEQCSYKLLVNSGYNLDGTPVMKDEWP